MNLKDMINIISAANAKREELASIKSEYEEALEQYRIARLFMKQKQEEVFTKEEELHTCSHPLSIMYSHSSFDLTHFNRKCVCCGYLYGGLGFEFPGDYINVETLLFGEEATKLCGFIRQRLAEISENNPNISLEEVKKIIVKELPKLEKTLAESRESKKIKRRVI